MDSNQEMSRNTSQVQNYFICSQKIIGPIANNTRGMICFHVSNIVLNHILNAKEVKNY